MTKYQQVAQLVKQAYETSNQELGQWMLHNHVAVVAQKAEDLSERFEANVDLAVAGAWLHDFGDAFVHRHADDHNEITEREAIKVLQRAGYSREEIAIVINKIIAPHSCKEGFLPATLEGKVVATADALAHLTTDFYVQFTWKHLPKGKTYKEFLKWVEEKIDHDFNNKIFFEEIRQEIADRVNSLKEVFLK